VTWASILFMLLTVADAQPSTPVLRDAILWLAPGRVSDRTARRYAKIIHREARRRSIHGFLFLAFIHTESRWNPRMRSSTDDFGLAQVHVAVRGSARFLGREAELYDPETNIREWGRLAAMWRDYHARSCHGASHRWWDHLKWGYRVRRGLVRVDELLQMLIGRFLAPGVS